MALSPIKIFENPQSSLAQILAGGNQTVTSIMDKAIQIGRDMSNKQLSQERDLLAMRQQETNLFQRRAENLQQNNEDAQNFARRAFESDRRYNLEQQQEARIGARDLFSQGIEQERLGLAERDVAVSEGGLNIRQQEEDRRSAEAAKKDAFISGLTNDGTAEELPAEKKSFGERLGDVAEGVVGDIKSLFTTGNVRPQTIAATPALDAGKLRGEIDVSTARIKALEGKDAEAYKAEVRRRGELETQLRQAEATQRPRTQASIESSARAEESLRMRKEKAALDAEEKEAKLLVGDTGAFTRQVPQAYVEGSTKQDLEAAKAYDKDPFVSEVNSARNYDEETYVNFPGMTLSDAQKEKRRQLWRFANKKGTSTSTSAVDSIPGI